LPIPKDEMYLNHLARRVRSGLYSVPAEDVAEAILMWINPTGLSGVEPESGGPSRPRPS
jgi:hypothetical protein